MRDNNNPEIAVIKSKNDHGISAANTKANKPKHLDPASSHREITEVFRVPLQCKGHQTGRAMRDCHEGMLAGPSLE